MRSAGRSMAIVVLVTAAVLIGPPVLAASATATFSRDSTWDAGYQGRYTITNGSTGQLTGWRVEFDLPAGSTVGTFWDTLITASGNHYVATNRKYNATIAPGTSTSFGFLVSGTGDPVDCTLNGASCGGGSDGGTVAPGVPGTPVVTGTDVSSISLSWAPAAGTVTGYRVYEGPTVVATTSSTSATVTDLAAASTHTYSVTAFNGTGESAHSGTITAATQGGTADNSFRSGPYYMPLDNNPQDLDEAMTASGERNFVFAFVLAPNAGGCMPTWDGTATVADDTAVLAKVTAVRGRGGDISVSFGGYNGLELGKACADATSLANAYQAVIDRYALTHIDLDIEGDDLGDVTGETRRFQAVAILRQRAAAAGRQLHVTLTLPMTTVGLSDLGRAEIQRVRDLGTQPDQYNLMTFDYGGPAASMAASVMNIAERAHTQLGTIFPELTDAQLYVRTGLILMNGHTDQPSELFTQQTFREVLGYAQQKHVARLQFWSLNRDRQCTGLTGWVDGKCSSVPQTPYEFTIIVNQYNG